MYAFMYAHIDTHTHARTHKKTCTSIRGGKVAATSLCTQKKSNKVIPAYLRLH